MTTLCKWCITLLVCTIIAIHTEAQTVAITSSQEIKTAHKMDETWLEVATDLGMNANIFPVDLLSDTDLRSKVDILIISNGLTPISTTQAANILAFMKSGGKIYLQSEYLYDFDINVLFRNLINQTGGQFEWQGHASNNLGPVDILNGLEDGLTTDKLDYFWYAAFGCGDAQVLPFMQANNQDIGFFYRNSNPAYGNIVSQTDHDWIRTVDNNPVERKALMVNILNVVNHGIESFKAADMPMVSIDEEVNFCTDTEITAEVIGADVDKTKWYVNSNLVSGGSSLDINSLTLGDTIYATVMSEGGCHHSEIRSSYVVYNIEGHTPNKNTTLIGNASACPGTTITIQADYDQSLPQLRHNWFLNGQDTPTQTDNYSSDDLKDGDILEHSLSYFNGCNTVNLPTTQTITIALINMDNPMLSIEGQAIFCEEGNIANLKLSSIVGNNPTIQWHVDGTLYEESTTSIQLSATTNHQDVKATVRYYTTCDGWITLSASTIVGVASITIETLELGNIDCENSEGFIEINANRTGTSYNWSNGASGNYLNNLSEGTYTVTATSAIGCVKSESFEITKTVFPLLDTITITQPTCNEGEGTVELYLADNNLSTINAQWINTNNEVVSTDLYSNRLPEGKYTVKLDVNGNCRESYEVEIFGFHNNDPIEVDTITVEQLSEVRLQANTSEYEDHRIEWLDNDQLNCTNCNRPTITATYTTSFDYYLISPEGCKVMRRLLVIVDIKDPYYAPSAFSPNNDGINDTYVIHTRADVYATSNLRIFDRWGSLIYEDESNEGWDGNAIGQPVQKGIFVYVQEFTDALGNTYIAKGSVTVL